MSARRLLVSNSRYSLRCAFLTVFFAAAFLTLFSVLHFVYTAPGAANAYLYRLQIHMALADRERIYIQRIVENGTYLPPNFQIFHNETCPEKFLEMTGPIAVNLSEITLGDMASELTEQVRVGGSWTPRDCIAKSRVAFLIPFRNRHQHLPILLRHMLPLLFKQRVDFTFFIINQEGDYAFNRAMLLNIGFLEAQKLGAEEGRGYDCFIFHDVDHIPESNRIYYGCSDMPKHFAEQLDIHLYRLEYEDFFGGVSGVSAEQFKEVNGFSNQFWGWGGEDDDFYSRIKHHGYNISRPPNNYGRYTAIVKHHSQEAQFLGRFSLLQTTIERSDTDGLNSVEYKKPLITQEHFFTNISVDVRPPKK